MNISFHLNSINNVHLFIKYPLRKYLCSTNGNVRSIRNDMCMWQNALTHFAFMSYHVYLFILNMQKPFPA